MAAPLPRDPRVPKVDADALERAFREVVDAPTETLEEEAQKLGRAHALLSDALRTD